jgi:pantoate kinase
MPWWRSGFVAWCWRVDLLLLDCHDDVGAAAKRTARAPPSDVVMSPPPLAISPGSVTGFFLPQFRPSPDETCSLGFALNLDEGVTAAVAPAAAHQVFLNGRPIDLPPVREVLDALAPEPVAVHLETPLPLGCGFGVSAAAALSTAFALDRRFGLSRSRAELGMTAHRAEVKHRTGIGDVAAQLCGGAVYRRCRTGPFDCVRLDTVPQGTLYYRSFGPLDTRAALGSAALARRLAEAGRRAVDWLEGHRAAATLDALLDRSLEFAEETGLLTHPQVQDAIRNVRALGGRATMIMLGQSVLATLPAADGAGWKRCGIDLYGTRCLP